MDAKLQTFLTLCRLMNYRLTAETLHLTQPAVTKQIQGLEQTYGVKLFTYDGRALHKTESARILEQYCKSLQYNYEEMEKALQKKPQTFLRVGATKTVGDYVIGGKIADFLKNPANSLTLTVDNTERLLKQLDDAELDFALIEGFFPKERYAHRLLREEPFVGVCARKHPFAGKVVSVEELKGETLLIREPGSGTRQILEHELERLGYATDVFARTVCISSFKVIKELLGENIGISFLYQAVLEDERELATFRIENFYHSHEFHVVYLKNTEAGSYVDLLLGEEH